MSGFIFIDLNKGLNYKKYSKRTSHYKNILNEIAVFVITSYFKLEQSLILICPASFALAEKMPFLETPN